MNAGLANLDTLKRQLLAEALQSSTQFDTALTNVGLGVAAQLEKFCNRKFARTVADTFTCYADRSLIILPRYPVESVSAIAQKSDEATGFVSLGSVSSIIASIDSDRGILQFGAQLGSYLEQVRITYTGGYFWNILEPTDGGYPTALPAGATALPDDLKLAWLLQSAYAWQVKDKLGADITTTGSAAPNVAGSLAGLDLVPAVKEMLNPHRRFA